MKTGIELIAEERIRQVDVEGFDEKHDEQHESGELAMAAALYATPTPLHSVRFDKNSVIWEDPWPWHDMIEPPRGGPCISYPAWDNRKKHDRLKQLKVAGALIAAEIDRLNRM